MADQTAEEVIAEINKELMDAYRSEEAFWKQRSRLLWLTLGDKNTGFFHAVSKGRKARNRLTVMENAHGEAVYEEELIAVEIARYFKDIFTTTSTDVGEVISRALSRKITDETNATLTSIPSAKEIKKALFAIHPDKAPGPDGFSASFFQANWDAVGPAIVAEVREFFITGSMPARINRTHMRLILKGQNAIKVADFRPIALCNVYYKIISKLLSLRLRPVLSGIISENQSAFLPGRAIADNVLITHEILHYLKTSDAKKHCYMAVKTDMSKAYDRLEWNFIQKCISTVSYSFLVNDTALGEVIPSRGIRQGDPLSPYVLILCGEVLSGLCRAGQTSGALTGVKIGHRCPLINHLLFADDTMIFTKASTENCSALTLILKDYEKASGQLINATKSSISFSSKTPRETRARVKLLLGIEKEGGTGKYLGLPELFSRRKRDLFSSIVDRIKLRAAAWSTCRLSSAGKLTMLKSVLTAVPTFSMSCFLLLVGLCDQIQSALTRFWWDHDPSTRNICWVAWDNLTQHKDVGGLGLRDIQDFNVAMLAKNAWRILTNPECLLARLLIGKYCHSSSFLSAPCPSSASHEWRGVVAGCQLLQLQLGKAIGNGNSTKVWSDSWISSTSRTIPFGPPTEASRDLFVSDLLIRGSDEWNHTMVESTHPTLVQDIYLIKPSIYMVEDTYVWLKTKTGSYSVKSGYYALREAATDQRAIQPPHETFNWQKLVWKLPTSPKLKLFLWKLCRGALALGTNLQVRGIDTNGACPHCAEPETALHLFFLCPFARQAWDLPPLSSRPDFSTAVSLHDCFELIATPARTVVGKAVSSAREWLLAQTSEPIAKTHTTHDLAIPPTEVEVVLCNTDAAWSVSKQAGLGWCFEKTTQGFYSEGSKAINHISSPLMAEALAMREALQEANRTSLLNVWFRTDSQELARAINSKSYPVELFGVLMDIEFLSLSFSYICFSFIGREHNGMADSIAKSALHRHVSILY
ncbi:uncharacterized protein LOC103833410 [Brassica rapa]|uniref:uncharacterized protein LOC103833410 n=1 Tax=Brassica campestris TaxID=3711 RepID=UPI0004F19933|nr:uncharacterized protein LOC103833410 [Brassica rapa]